MRFRATWPIEDPTRTPADLIAEAEADLPNVRPEGYKIRSKKWRIEGDTLHLEAFASKLPDMCKQGHNYTPENTAWDGQWRRCKACRKAKRVRSREADRARDARKRNGLADHLPADSLLFYVAALGGVGAVCSQLDHTDSDTFRRRLERAKSDGFMTVRKADDTCCRLLGVHPFVVFGDAWWTEDIHAVEEAA